MSDDQPRCVLSEAQGARLHRARSPVNMRRGRLFALAVSAVLSASLLTTAAIAAALHQRASPTRPTAALVLAGTADAKTVDLRVGEHRFRIPRAYFRHPPHPSGMGTGFYVRALWPGMEPETEETRAALRASIRTQEGQRVLLILLQLNQPGMPWPVARWMLQNLANAPGAAEAERADLEAFAPASPKTFELRARFARPEAGATWGDNDLFHGTLADGRFAGMSCGRDPDPGRPTSCNLRFDRRQGTWLQVTFIRTQLPRWREIAEATFALVDGFAVEDNGGGGAGP